MVEKGDIILTAFCWMLFSIFCFSMPIGFTLGFGIDSLKNGRNTGGTALITEAHVDAETYGDCELTLSYYPKNANKKIDKNVTSLCMPDPVGKRIAICYNRWHPINVAIDDDKLTESYCDLTGFDAAVRCVWAGMILVCMFAITLVIAVIGGWNKWPKYKKISDQTVDDKKIEMADV